MHHGLHAATISLISFKTRWSAIAATKWCASHAMTAEKTRSISVQLASQTTCWLARKSIPLSSRDWMPSRLLALRATWNMTIQTRMSTSWTVSYGTNVNLKDVRMHHTTKYSLIKKLLRNTGSLRASLPKYIATIVTSSLAGCIKTRMTALRSWSRSCKMNSRCWSIRRKSF